MASSETLEKFEVRNRFTNAVQFTAEIGVTPGMTYSVKLGLAVEWAVKARANLAGASLSGAYLVDASLAGANFARASLSGANLAGATLARANLAGATLAGAYLAGATLAGAKNADLAIARARILPDGDIIGWKKCRDDVIVKLRIPEDSPRSHAFGRKCRAKFADVLEIFGADKAVSSYDPKFTYTAGERVEALNWSDKWEEECAGGVHFYISRLEAEAH